MLVVAVAATVMAIAGPVMTDVIESTRVSTATRDLENELQTARLRAVSQNRRLRLRTSCPAAGQFRIVEVLGTAADDAANRCTLASYPYPAADTNPLTLPNLDGPVRYFTMGITASTVNVEFRPDGTAWDVVSGTPQAIASPVSITVMKGSRYKMVTVNALGKIEIPVQ